MTNIITNLICTAVVSYVTNTMEGGFVVQKNTDLIYVWKGKTNSVMLEYSTLVQGVKFQNGVLITNNFNPDGNELIEMWKFFYPPQPGVKPVSQLIDEAKRGSKQAADELKRRAIAEGVPGLLP